MTPSGSRDRPDYPFYAGWPVSLSGAQWLVVLVGVGAAFWLLITPWTHAAGPWGMWPPALLFCLVPLCALALVAGRAWTTLFRRLHARDLLLMVRIAALNLMVTAPVALLFSGMHHTTANPLFQVLGDADTAKRAMLLAAMIPQLLGEELLTILPFLALLWWLHGRMQLGRGTSVALAWFLSAVPFALVHLPTYGWNLPQCLAIIGTARLVLTLAYLLSRNLWVSTGAHVINDWALVGFALLANSLPH